MKNEKSQQLKFYPSLGISHNLHVVLMGLGVSDFVPVSHICFSVKSLSFFCLGLRF